MKGDRARPPAGRKGGVVRQEKPAARRLLIAFALLVLLVVCAVGTDVIWRLVMHPNADDDEALRRPKPPGSVAALMEDLRSGSPLAKVDAAINLGRHQPPAFEAIPALIAALSDKDNLLRTVSALALGYIGQKERGKVKPEAFKAVPPLLDLLQHDNDSDAREAAMAALAMIGQDDGGKVRAALTKAMDDEDVSIRSTARLTLKEFLKATEKEPAARPE